IYNKIPTRYSVKATVPNALGGGYNPYKILDAMVARVTAGQVHKTLSDLKEKSEKIAAENDFWTLAESVRDTQIIRRLLEIKNTWLCLSEETDLYAIK